MKKVSANSNCLPLTEAIKQSKCLPRNVSALDVFNAFKFSFGYAPRRNENGRCIYSVAELKTVALTSCIKDEELLEINTWRKVLPLAGCNTRMAAMEKLARMEIDGWLIRCSYRRGCLLLCEKDAEQLCFIRESQHKSRPARWSVPVAFPKVQSSQPMT